MAVRTTYELTSDKLVKASVGYLHGITIITDGTNNATVSLYDVNSAGDIDTTNKITEITVVGSNMYGGRNWPMPLRFNNGLYADVTGTGASYIVEFA